MYRQDPDMLFHAVKKIRDIAPSSLFTISNPIPAIQAALILCLWPVPMDSMWKDQSHALSGAALSLAVQNGLHVAGHEQDFRRTQQSITDKEQVFIAHLWIHCLIHFQRFEFLSAIPDRCPEIKSTSLCDGLPFYVIEEPKLSGRDHFLDYIKDRPLLHRYRCHKILTSAILTITGSIDMEGSDNGGLVSLINLFAAQIQDEKMPSDNDMCMILL
jgi:transcriptional regulatory protein LEU3